MNIYVEEIPKSCLLCELALYLNGTGIKYYCCLTIEDVDNYTDTRHEDCPLKLVREYVCPAPKEVKSYVPTDCNRCEYSKMLTSIEGYCPVIKQDVSLMVGHIHKDCPCYKK